MPSMIQIRNVPDEIHRTLKARASLAGMSLSDYLLREIRQAAVRPSLDEMLERLRQLPPVELSETPAEAVRAERDRR
ncbi:hypothetical protein [Beijerinckia sp. L45]|uniref:FitA-like ribbon-helix-helix domain-containing protein n=1 Tax=Beijerinckia sp. L45 TaxID=1641855 RepID=UPI00131B8C9B|nr:hypothetical protein [Beijerinckia sp. L45]